MRGQSNLLHNNIQQIKSKSHFWKELVFTNCRQIYLKGDQCGCVEEVNNEGEIEIDRPNECPQDDQHPEKPGFFILRYTRCAIFTYR